MAWTLLYSLPVWEWALEEASIGGIGLLSTIIATPVVLRLEEAALALGYSGLLAKLLVAA